MALSQLLKKTAIASRTSAAAASRRLGAGTAVAGVAALGLSLALGTARGADAATMTTQTAATGTSFGTLDTQPGTAATEAQSSVSVAMFEFNWSSFEPKQGVFSASYLATMESYLHAYQAAGMKVTLGLGLQNPPSWVFSLPNATYVNQNGAKSAEANFVFSSAVRRAAAGYLAQIAADIPLTSFWAIRLTSGGDGEMLYPPGGTYWAFDKAALTGTGLAAGVTPNPYPNWRPGHSGLAPTQIDQWVNWYIGGLDKVTNWQMQTLASLGFGGYYQTVTPGSGTRPDGLAAGEQQNLPNDGTTGVGAVWDRYYAMLPNKNNVVAYISSVADESGNDDSCRSADTTMPLTSNTMDSWSATRWISRIAHQNGFPVGGENVGYGIPASLDTHYLDASSTGMMADALRQAQTCGFQVFYWAHDIHLWDGTIPFTRYAPAHNVNSNLALTATASASNTLAGFPASAANDASQATYWQAANSTGTFTLQLARATPVDRIVLELPQGWGDRHQTIEVDGSTDGTAWTTLVPSTAYLFSAGNAAGNNVVSIPVPSTTVSYIRLDISNNDAQGAPQIAEFQAYSN